MNPDLVLLLGRKDDPTDAVEEYCHYLCEALGQRSVKGEIARVPWKECVSDGAFEELRRASANWRNRWVFLQYTALSWSERGFPWRALKFLRIVREAEAYPGVVFHDVEPYAGTRTVDVLRRQVQLRVMRRILRVADLAVFTVPLNVVSWLGSASTKSVFIPVGANLPETRIVPESRGDPGVTRIAVYGITGGAAGNEECVNITRAIRFATERGAKLELHVFGRGAAERETELREKLHGLAVALRFDGLLPAAVVASAIQDAHATLFVRGAISTRRGSAIAGIACGKPTIAYSGPDTAAPITEAGVVLVNRNRPTELGEALLHVATNQEFRDSLSQRSAHAQEMFFSWQAIAKRYVEAMNLKT